MNETKLVNDNCIDRSSTEPSTENLAQPPLNYNLGDKEEADGLTLITCLQESAQERINDVEGAHWRMN